MKKVHNSKFCCTPVKLASSPGKCLYILSVSAPSIQTNKAIRYLSVVFSRMELHKLNSVQHVLEKSVSTTLGHLKDVQYHQDITESFKKLEEERKAERRTLQEKINETLELLKNKTDLLKENRIAEITDFKKFKMEMIAIQENIQNLRAGAKMKLELLKKDYVEIAEDVDYYTEMVPSWSEVTKDHTYVGSMKKSLSLKGPACKEAKDFMEFVHKSNGHENGWRKEDHQLFLKYRKKFKNSDETARELHETLPDLSIEDINRHEEWYKQYLTLQKRKKDVIREWKKSKGGNNRNAVCMDASGDHQVVVSRVQNPEEVRKKLAEWKLEKQHQQIKANREIQRVEEQRRKELEMQQHKRAEELKRLVEEWKTTRTVLEQQEIERKKCHAENEKRRRAAEANRMIRQFQSQDDLYISKILKQRRQEDAPKPSRSKSSQMAKRDPRRLLKPTRQWINRVHDDNVYSNEGAIIPLRSLPKLSVPEWRKTVQ